MYRSVVLFLPELPTITSNVERFSVERPYDILLLIFTVHFPYLIFIIIIYKQNIIKCLLGLSIMGSIASQCFYYSLFYKRKPNHFNFILNWH